MKFDPKNKFAKKFLKNSKFFMSKFYSKTPKKQAFLG